MRAVTIGAIVGRCVPVALRLGSGACRSRGWHEFWSRLPRNHGYSRVHSWNTSADLVASAGTVGIDPKSAPYAVRHTGPASKPCSWHCSPAAAFAPASTHFFWHAPPPPDAEHVWPSAEQFRFSSSVHVQVACAAATRAMDKNATVASMYDRHRFISPSPKMRIAATSTGSSDRRRRQTPLA